MDIHDFVSQIKELAIELGKTPTKREYQERFGHRYEGKHNYSTLVQAAGLEPNKKRKIDNTIFEKNIEDHLDRFTQEDDKLDPKRFTAKNWCIVSDIHWPFHHPQKMEAFFKRAEKKKYDLVIINGDARDFYSHGKFPRSENIFTPREENSLARKLNEDFWNKIKSFNPQAKCIQCLGNHSVRPLKRVIEEYPAAEDWIVEALKKEFTFEGVETIFNPRDFIIVNDEVAVFHGFKMKLGDHRDWSLMSCAVGHTHRGGVVYRRIMNKQIFEANSGYLGNPHSKGLSYTNSKITEWTHGYLEFDGIIPTFIPL